jgi:flagellar hook-associated protein 3 FlgL
VRVTNTMMRRDSIQRLQTNLQAIERAQRQISSGRRVELMSDDPSAASEVIRLSSSLRAIDQFRRNVRTGEARGAAAENALTNMGTTLDRAIELAISQASTTATADTRLATKAEVDQLLGYAVGLGNTKLGDTWIFSGSRGTEAPFQVPPTPTDPFTALRDALGDPVNPYGNPRVEIGDGMSIAPNPNGTEAFLDTGAFEALRALSTALGANDVPGIAAAQTALQTAGRSLQGVLGGLGARTNELQNASDTLEASETSITIFRSDLRDVEVEKAISELSGRQTAYQAAMLATSRVMGQSLADYLR